MRINIILGIFVALSLILCPIAALGESEETAAEIVESVNEEEQYISVMSPSTGKVSRVDMREYIVGCVAAEMPATYHSEALRAQAVASYTYAKKVIEQNKKISPFDADITDSSDTHQGYIDKNARKEKWGNKYEEYEEKISSAVDSVFGSYMEYKGETVLAVYHSVSAGSTQSAENLWGEEIPYLQSVESPGDRLSPDYISESFFDKEEFSALLKECGVIPSGDEEDWLEEIKINADGYASSVVVCGREISASKFREIFSLRSTCFEIDCSGGGFTVRCKGYGHGAGMSQYGADYMARQGSGWREILMHYYQGVEIKAE